MEGICACLQSAFEAFRSQYTSDAFRDTVPSREAIRQRLIDMRIYVASGADGEIVGTIASSFAGEEGHLRGMAVNPTWQGQGIAEQLLLAAEEDLLVNGCTRVTLDTTIPLQRAIRFYRKNGFVPTGRVRDFFGMPLHEFTKPLRSI